MLISVHFEALCRLSTIALLLLEDCCQRIWLVQPNDRSTHCKLLMKCEKYASNFSKQPAAFRHSKQAPHLHSMSCSTSLHTPVNDSCRLPWLRRWKDDFLLLLVTVPLSSRVKAESSASPPHARASAMALRSVLQMGAACPSQAKVMSPAKVVLASSKNRFKAPVQLAHAGLARLQGCLTSIFSPWILMALRLS